MLLSKDRTPEQKTKEANVIRPHTDPSKKDNSYFGYSIAVSKNLLVVGATYRVMLIMLKVITIRGSTRPNQGFVEVFEITDDSGIVKYHKRRRCF